MRVSAEFSKYAESYDSYNLIQEQVATKLLSFVQGEPQYILDLGCGRGALARKILWDYKKLVGVDFAPKMLELHPKSQRIELLYGNFNESSLFQQLSSYRFDYILSASALQWANDIEKTFHYISSLHTPVALAIFTSNTFKTLYKTASLQPLLPSATELERLQKNSFHANFEVVEYTLEFESVREMLRYIKRSGVSGARNLLSYKEMKQLIKSYPHNYLEFEVAFISSNIGEGDE